MKFFSTILTFGLLSTSFFASAAVIPAEKREVVEKRAPDLATAIGIVQTLYENVKVYTGSINSTTADLPANPSVVESAAAAAKVNDAVSQITTLINAAIAEINTSSKEKRDVIVTRQAPTDLAGVITNLLIEISSALNNVIASLGLSALLAGTLGGLVTALSGLLLALVPVVNNLLELVRRLLAGLLTGLSAALLGLII